MSMSNDSGSTSGKSSVATDTADQIRDRAGTAAEALKDVGAKASATVQDKAAGLLGTAKSMASDAGSKVNDTLGDHKSAGAERVKGISGAIRRAADELQDELPPAATYIRRAADEIDSLADAVQRRDVRQLVGDVQSFARRQPAAFLGATVLGGFAVMRLLKAPTAAHGSEASSSPTSVKGPAARGPSAGATSLVPLGASSDLDEASIVGGSGDSGGISPVAPGFETTSGSASNWASTGTKAGRS